MKKVLFIFGTRPEAVKMAPLFHRIRESGKFQIILCSTGQHSEMLKPALTFFEMQPDYDLNLMKPNQTISDLSSSILTNFDQILANVNPNLVVVQGDTTTTMVGALCAFYRAIQIAHLEAGLRSHNKFAPYPEETNRILTTHLADHHFAPTPAARDNLILEGISSETVHLVGNTVVDALLWAQERMDNIQHVNIPDEFSAVDFTKKLILVTGHRRESFGQPFIDLCSAIKSIAEKESVEIIYPVHLNPNVMGPVHSILDEVKNVHLIEPVSYPVMIYLMKRAYLILTDSGGIQEEAPSFKKPVLVMRDVTERPEGIQCGIAKLVGTTKTKIYEETVRLLRSNGEYQKMTAANNPYGDGKASQRVVEIIERILLDAD